MKILFVAMPFSIHTARWIKQLENSGHRIFFFSSFPYATMHPDLKKVNYYEYYHALPDKLNPDIIYHSIHWFEINFKFRNVKKLYGKLLRFLRIEKTREKTLELVLKKVKPDIIHTLETQHAGYQVAEVKKNWKGVFPPWIHSNWGIDLHFFGKIAEHKNRIKNTLQQIDLLIVEGKRDELLAIEYGFSGKTKTFPSVGGGFKVPKTKIDPPSKRKKILLKGSQDIVRRGLVGMRALARCVDVLKEYEIVLYSGNEVTKLAAESFFYDTGKKIQILEEVSYEKMLLLNSEARINISINMSDGLPNSMLEAMMMGAFPIQSDTSLASEWIENLKTGMIVPSEDPDIIEIALRKAITDDELVDRAAFINRTEISIRLDYNDIKGKVLNMYQSA